MEALAALTPEAIAELKAKHGGLHIIEVKISDTDTAVAYLKPADRNVVAYGLTKSMKSQIVEAGEFILKNCYVDGDERLKLTGPVAENKIQLTAAIAAASLLDMFEVEVKNVLGHFQRVISDRAEDDELPKMAAMISWFLHIPFPEQLSDEEFGAKFAQADWLRRNPQARGVTASMLVKDY